MDLNGQIYADRDNVLSKGYSSDRLLLLVSYGTFNKMRYQAGNQMFQPNPNRDARHNAVFCDAPVIVTDDIIGWRWLTTP